MTKYILVSGGVVSGIGKGVIGTRHIRVSVPLFSFKSSSRMDSFYQPRRPACCSRLPG
jgi:hypothetical protein